MFGCISEAALLALLAFGQTMDDQTALKAVNDGPQVQCVQIVAKTPTTFQIVGEFATKKGPKVSVIKGSWEEFPTELYMTAVLEHRPEV
jgi:hypothetical protein